MTGKMDSGLGKRTKARRDGENTIIKMKSLRHRPGAMKRKQKMESSEMQRFSKNLAQLIGRQTSSVAGETTSPLSADRWAALRSFIGVTMEQDPAFVENNQTKQKMKMKMKMP